MKKTRALRARRPKRVHYVRPPPPPALEFTPHAFAAQVAFIEGDVPKIFVSRDAYSKMYHFVDIGEEEVGWLGTAYQTRLGNFVIDEVFLVEQEVSAAQTELSEDGQAKLAQHLIDTYEDGVEKVNRLRFWGHSHVAMPTNPSAQDEKQMEVLRANGCPWFIRGILNKRGRMQFDIFLWESGVKIVDAAWSIYNQVDYTNRHGIEAEFKEKVVSRPYSYHSAHASGSWAKGVPVVRSDDGDEDSTANVVHINGAAGEGSNVG